MPSFVRRHLVPADLLLLAGIDAGGKHGSKRLAAEADADHRRAFLDGRLDGCELLLQKGIAVDLIDADRTAEHDEEIGILGRGEIVDAGFEIVKRDAAISEHALERAGILEGDMTYGDGVAHLVHRSLLRGTIFRCIATKRKQLQRSPHWFANQSGIA